MNEYKTLSRIYHDINLKNNYLSVYHQRFSNESTYRLPLKIKDQTQNQELQLFVVVTTEIYEMTTNILHLKARLNNLIQDLPPVAIEGHFLNYILVDELMKTNEIEGVRSTRKEIADAINANRKQLKTQIRFENQAKQYMKILYNYAFKIDTPQNLRILYDELLEGELKDKEKPDGMIFRKDPVTVYSSTNKTLHEGLMPESAIIIAIQDLINFYSNKSLPVLLRIAISHYYFGFIHPFYDGNGRFGRLLSSIMLAQEFDKFVALRLSVTIHEHIKAYYKAFETVNDRLNKGDATPFYIMFLQVLEQALIELLSDLEEKRNLLVFAFEKIQNLTDLSKDEQRTLYVMQQAKVFSTKNLSINALKDNLKFSRNKMQKILDSLETKGYILIDRTHKPYKHVLNETLNI